MKKIGKRSIWISIVVAAMLLTGCGNQTGSADRATGSDAVESVPSTTEVVKVTTEEVTTEAVIEAAVSGSEKPEAVPATTEIGGGKKKAEETAEEQKPSTNHSNSGNASSGQSTTPKPSNSGSSGNSGNSGSNSGSSNSGGNSGNSGSNNSGNSGNSGSNNSGNNNSNNGGSTAPATTEAPKPSTTEAPTTQHQHVYDQVVVDTPEQSVYHPAEYKTVPAMKCHGCGGLFTSADAYFSHPCGDDYGFTDTTDKIKVQDEYTETIPAKTHRECKCGARE